MRTNKAKGWGIVGHIGLDVDNVNVHLGGVCTCSWRKQHCLGTKRCQSLFEDGGNDGTIRQLKALMGKDFPKAWENERLWVTDAMEASKRSLAISDFKRKHFLKCRPVEIEIRVKKA